MGYTKFKFNEQILANSTLGTNANLNADGVDFMVDSATGNTVVGKFNMAAYNQRFANPSIMLEPVILVSTTSVPHFYNFGGLFGFGFNLGVIGGDFGGFSTSIFNLPQLPSYSPLGGGGGSGGGSTGGNNSPTPPPIAPFNQVPMSVMIPYLTHALNLNTSEVAFLNTSVKFTRQLYNFILESTLTNKVRNAKKHVQLFMTNTAYYNFVMQQVINDDIDVIWWNDNIWLNQINYEMNETATNQYMQSISEDNPKPLFEYADRCEGLKALALKTSENNGQEVVGFKTMDGKFIITGIGDNESVPLNFKTYNGTAYYCYSETLGLPNLTYAGMQIINGEIRIPLKACFHSHPENEGVPINFAGSRSDDDWQYTYIGFKHTNYSFPFFVIEPSNGKFTTGYISPEKSITSHLFVQTNLTLEQICSHLP
jgi:hypothetical protein